ncbi:MAG: response regulator transcription factor [Bacteroidia bacterium]
MIRILIADDHRILLDGLKVILDRVPEFDVVATAEDGLQVLELLEEHDVDVLLLDLQMPNMDGLETTKRATEKYPGINVLMLTTNDEGSIITSMFKHGATGYLLKMHQ